MGSIFAEEVLGIERPRVRLLSIGEEPEKGNQLTLDAHALLEASSLRFEGNVEGRALLEGEADVVVCDGFTGNVALKTLEGTIRSLLVALRSELEASTRGKLGGLPDPAGGETACGRGSIPRRPVAATSSGCAGSSSSPTAPAPGSRSPTRSGSPPAGSTTTSSAACGRLFRSAW